MPSCFVNRTILENCSTVDDAEIEVNSISPLGPFHMTVADKERAQTFHMQQGRGNQNYIRRASPDKPLHDFILS